MKKLRNFIMLALLVGFATSCDDIEQPFPQWDDPSVKYGAYARKLSGPTGDLMLSDPAGSNITVEVEFYDENKGQNVASYAWKVTFIDRKTAGAKNKTVDLFTIPASEFKTSVNGLPGTSITFNFQEVLNALGFTTADINCADDFRFDATITKTDGTTFDNSNTDPILIAQFPYSALVRFTKRVVGC